jgi:hypothetical protein
MGDDDGAAVLPTGPRRSGDGDDEARWGTFTRGNRHGDDVPGREQDPR